MEECVSAENSDEAVKIYQSQYFFQNLPEMDGAIKALKEMVLYVHFPTRFLNKLFID
jgi:hypothetical protein